MMSRYEATPGSPGQTPATWPAESRVARASDRPTLVMLAHPKCVCTRASIAELAELMARLPGRVAARVLFMKPHEFPDGWEQTDTWRSAEHIPGVTVIRDVDGKEAARFGAVTSGQTALYGADGRLLFSGGITASRGHIGDNAGLDRIVSLVTRGEADRGTSKVFGCAIDGPGAPPAEGGTL
jgi:CBS domain-containing protein